MIKELENKYLVLKWDDIGKYLNNSETRKLAMVIEKIEVNRLKEGKRTNKKFVVVSETMKNFEYITNLVLNEVNGIKSFKKPEALEKAKKLIAEKKKNEIITKATTKIAGVKDAKD